MKLKRIALRLDYWLSQKLSVWLWSFLRPRGRLESDYVNGVAAALCSCIEGTVYDE